MDRDEILKKSRQENQNRDEMEAYAFSKAGQRACAVGGIVCMVLILAETVRSGSMPLGAWAVYLSMTGTMLLTKYKHLKKRHELICGLIEIGLALMFLAMHITRLVRE